jgi:superfamily II DNA or RNA helicase
MVGVVRSPYRPQPHLGLAAALSYAVTLSVRRRGEAYFRRGLVRDLTSSDTELTATVQGSSPYGVKLMRVREGYLGFCECPFFFDRDDICKHIWALVLAADERGLLPPASEETWLDPGHSDYLDNDRIEDDHQRPRLVPPPAVTPLPVNPWEQFLRGMLHDSAAREAARPAPRFVGGEIIYVIDAPATSHGQGIVVHTQWRQLRKNGEWGKPQPAGIAVADLAQLPDSLDREILTTLMGAADPYTVAYENSSARAAFRLSGPITDRALWLLASSRRLYLRGEADPPAILRPVAADTGAPWIFRPEISAAADGTLHFHGSLSRDADSMALTEPQLLLASGYVVARGALSRLEHGGAFSWLSELRRRGPATIPAHAAPLLVEALARTQVDRSVLPAELQYEVVDGTPQPRVKIVRSPGDGAASYRLDLHAIVQFNYDGVIVPADPPISAYDPATRRLIRRDAAAEAAAVGRLQQLGFKRGWAYPNRVGEMLVGPGPFARAVRTLIDEGWHVEAHGAAFRAASALRVRVRSGVDWFELHGDLDFGDGRTATLNAMLAALKRGDSTIVLDDGTQGMVPEEWLRRYARIAAFGEVEGEHVRYKPSQAALLDALLEGQPAVEVDDLFRRARAELQTFRGIAAVAPGPSFTGTLRPYQQEALGWFEFLRRFGLGGCLADDMGLGKTVMVLALLDGRRDGQGQERRPSLAVVPRSLVFNWIAEARRFAPELRVLDYTGMDRASADLSAYDLVLTTYGTLRRDAAQLSTQVFDYVILDEAQAIKNAATASAKAVRLLVGRHKLALSGTPVENHVRELWSIFEFLNPGLLGSSTAFTRASLVQANSSDDLALVARALRPLILRRTKDQVEPELPSRTEQTIYCELDTEQRRFYDDLRAHYRASLLARVDREGLNRSKMHVLEALLRLRQAACHAGLVDRKRMRQPSAKFDVLVPQLLEVIAEGHKALVFSQFTELLGLLRQHLDSAKIRYEYLDGKTRDRAARVEHFASDPDCRLFLISLKAGGLGLNLTQAEYVFLLDPWWNPAAEAQAIDRAHRIGQTRHVFAYRLIAKDTVEEKVAELQASKRALADAILTADPALIRTLGREDLELLLS